MPDFNGFIGASVLAPNSWTRVGTTTPVAGDIYTATASMLYTPGFTTRDMSEPPTSVFSDVDGVRVLTGGPDDDAVIYLAVMPDGVDTTNRSVIQPYLKASRYALEAGIVREHSGLLIPAGWYVYAYASKSDVLVNIFGVEGRPTRFKRDTTT